ncbi:conserved uncharacterized protein (C-terminal fragment), partial [Ustilago hordei]
YPNKDRLGQVLAAAGDWGVFSGVESCTRQHGGTRPTFMLVNFSDGPAVDGPVVAGDVLNNVTRLEGGAAASSSPASRLWALQGRLLTVALAIALLAFVM